MPNLARATIWQDFYGRTRQTTLKGNASLATVQAAIAALSDASLLDCWQGSLMGPSGTAIAGPYNSASDEAIITLMAVDGTLVNIVVPAPDPSIFLADNRTVNAGDANVLTLVAAATGVVIAASGSAVASYVGGTRPANKGGWY